MRKSFRPALAVLLAGLGAGLLLVSCAGLPAPRSDSDALVVGYVQLEFPDGFLGQPPRTVRSDILLHFDNLTKGTRFSRFTRNGYFSFRAAGGEQLRLQSYEYSADETDYQNYLNDDIGLGFSTEPGRVLDAGRITIRYTAPKITNRVTFAQSTYLEDADVNGKSGPILLSLRHDYWSYQRGLVRLWDPTALEDYLHRTDRSGRWRAREVQR